MRSIFPGLVEKLRDHEIAELRDRWKTKLGTEIKRELLNVLRIHVNDRPVFFDELKKLSASTLPRWGLEDMRGLELTGENLDGILFIHNDVSYSSFINCSLNGSSFQGSVVSRSDFSGSTFIDADLLQIYADYAIFDRCHFTNTMMMSCDHRYGSFREAIFLGNAMNGSDYSDSDFESARFLNADARNVKFPDSLDPSRLSDCIYSKYRL